MPGRMTIFKRRDEDESDDEQLEAADVKVLNDFGAKSPREGHAQDHQI